MKSSVKRRVIRIAAVMIIVLLFVPFPIRYKDGGTVKYTAALYCVTKRHSIALKEGAYDGYYIGTEIEILGFEIYNDVELYRTGSGGD